MKIKKINFKTIGFILLWMASLSIMIVSSIMVETQMSFAEDPNKVVKVTIQLEPEQLPITYTYNDILVLLEDRLPKNITYSKCNCITYGDEEITTFVIADTKQYEFKGSFHIKFDMTSIAIRSALNTMGLILITFGVILWTINKLRERTTQYVKAIDTISDVSEFYRPVIWQLYEDKVNKKRKIAQWRANCSKLENKLDESKTRTRFIRKSVRERNENDLRLWARGTLEDKLANKYCYRKMELREWQTDKWIEENLEFKTIKYDMVSYRLIFVGRDIKNRQDNPNDTVTPRKSLKITLENLPRLIMSMGFAILIAAIVFDLNGFSGTVIVSIFLSILNMVWNTYLSNNYGKTFFHNYEMADVEFRKAIALEYKDYVTAETFVEPEVIEVSKIQLPEETSNDQNKQDSD